MSEHETNPFDHPDLDPLKDAYEQWKVDSIASLNRRYELGLLTFTEYTQAAKAMKP